MLILLKALLSKPELLTSLHDSQLTASRSFGEVRTIGPTGVRPDNDPTEHFKKGGPSNSHQDRPPGSRHGTARRLSTSV